MPAHPGHRSIIQLAQEDHGTFLLTLNCVWDAATAEHAELWDADCVLCDASIGCRLSHDEAASAGAEHVCEPDQ